MREMSEISIIRLKETYLFTEKDCTIRKLLPSFSTELNKNLEMLFVPEDTTEDAVLLEAEDINWFNPAQGDFNYEIDFDLSEAQFYRTDIPKELTQFLDCKIGQRLMDELFEEKELKNMYFYVDGIIYPATEENNKPTKENVRIYDITGDQFIVPEKFKGSYYLENDCIEDAPSNLWPIIKEMAE